MFNEPVEAEGNQVAAGGYHPFKAMKNQGGSMSRLRHAQ